MVWQCLDIHPYWESVLETLNDLGDWSLQSDPRMLLLGIMDDVVASRHMKLLLFYARKEILFRWKQPTPPTRVTWVSAVNVVLPLYRLTYISRTCPQKCNKV